MMPAKREMGNIACKGTQKTQTYANGGNVPKSGLLPPPLEIQPTRCTLERPVPRDGAPCQNVDSRDAAWIRRPRQPARFAIAQAHLRS